MTARKENPRFRRTQRSFIESGPRSKDVAGAITPLRNKKIKWFKATATKARICKKNQQTRKHVCSRSSQLDYMSVSEGDV